MTFGYLLIAAILFSCILADRFSGKFGMPALILFMAVGMIFGCDGLFKIQFDNYGVAEKVCAAALVFIMFYGGFNTKWQSAKCVAVRATILSTLGVLVTAGLTGVFCYFVLHFSYVESFLIGAVLSSTDAASVFSILRGKHLNLRDGTASLLEIESGSNDPMSYLLTMIGISLLGKSDTGNIPLMIFMQLALGILVGVVIALIGIVLLTKTNFIPEGLETIFVIAIVIFSFGLAELIGGNSYLSVYLLGILLGNSRIRNKNILIPFFDGVTGLAQILIFFLLGLLAFPHRMPDIMIPALFIALFLTFVARPIAVFGTLPSIPVQYPAVSAGFLGGASGSGIYRVCDHGHCRRRRYLLRPVPHRIYGGTAFRSFPGYVDPKGSRKIRYGRQFCGCQQDIQRLSGRIGNDTDANVYPKGT